MYRKRNILISIIILIITAFSACFLEYKPKSNKEISQILGIKNAKIEDFKHSGNWNLKDYDDIEVYKLSVNTIQSFVSQSSLLLYSEEYKDDSLTWNKIDWNKTPIDMNKFKELYNIAFMKRIDSDYDMLLMDIAKVLNSRHAYYALCYTTQNHIVHFYILDTEKKTLYITYLKV